MSAGIVQNVLLCVPVTSDQASTVDQQVCPPSGNQYFHLQSQQAYVLSPASAGYLEGLTEPFDYAAAAGFFALAFTTIVAVWMVSATAGSLLDFIRRA